MLKDYHPAEYHDEVYYTYDYNFDSNSGFTFPCNSHGEINLKTLTKAATENLIYCNNNKKDFEWHGKVKHTWHKRIPAYGYCSCGNRIDLVDEFLGACECVKCGKWYNLFGQELLSPEHWEQDEEPEYVDTDSYCSDYGYEEEEREEE